MVHLLQTVFSSIIDVNTWYFPLDILFWLNIPCSVGALDADFSSYALFLYSICGACAPAADDDPDGAEAPPAADPAKRSAAAIAALVAATVGATRS